MSSRTPHATIDIETDPFRRLRDPVPFASAMHDGKHTVLFWGPACIIDLVNACVKSGKKRIYYAHNGGKFDLHFLLPSLVHMFGHDNLKLLCIGTRLVQIIVKDVCEFRDSFAIIPKALKSIGGKKLDIDIWKLEKNANDLINPMYQNPDTKVYFAYETFKKDCAEKGMSEIGVSPREFYRELICKYLRRDCTGLHEAISEFFELYGVNMTLASAAFKFMEKTFNVKAPSSNEQYDEKFRPFYFAGHVEFFGLGVFTGNYKICDINSAFPAAMMHDHWFATSYISRDSVPTHNKERCFYKVRCVSNGALPYREEGGGVSFPRDKEKRTFYATGWELFAGIELKLVSRVEYLEIYQPTQCENFGPYIKYFYEKKKNAETEAERNFAKLFLNAYYGRLALNPREFRDVKITPYGDIPAPEKKKIGDKEITIQWEHSYDAQDGAQISFWQRPSNHGEKPLRFYNVSTAASITGWVRAFLLRSIHKCKGVLYCDTDSIIALDTSALELGNELGQWKLEKEPDFVAIAGKKLYAARDKEGKWKTASKGVRLTPEQIVEVARGNQQSFSFDAPAFSVYSKKRYTTRRVNRDDKRIRTGKQKVKI